MNTPLYINTKILTFVTKREAQYKIVQQFGKSTVPDFSRKLNAIAHIRRHFQGIRPIQDLCTQCSAVVEMATAIEFILPSPYSRFQKQRKEILDLIQYCRETALNQTPVIK